MFICGIHRYTYIHNVYKYVYEVDRAEQNSEQSVGKYILELKTYYVLLCWFGINYGGEMIYSFDFSKMANMSKSNQRGLKIINKYF